MQTPMGRKGWLSRNWKWVVGLLGGVILLSCICAVGAAGIAGAGVYGAFSLLKNNPVYGQALDIVRGDRRAQQMLGTPIEAGWYIRGEISETGATGEADFSIPVSGPKGSGRIDVVAEKSRGEWTITLLQLVMDGTHERLLIIGEGAEPAPR
jgi:hypothetical protein